MVDVDTFVPAGGFMYITLLASSTMKVPGNRSDADITCVNGTPFTNSISVRRPMGVMVEGQPEGIADVPKLGVHVCAQTCPHDHHQPDNTSDPERIAVP